MQTFTVSTNTREQFIDITSDVSDVVKQSGISSGACIIYTPHTTAAITINENADPDVMRDILYGLQKIVPSAGYHHSEGNAPAHIKSSLIGCSKQVIIEDGRLVLGAWQGIYFCEFDGPRLRKVHVSCHT